MKLRMESGCYFFFILLGLSGAGLANKPQSNLSKNTSEVTNKPTTFSILKDKFKAKNPKLSLQLGGYISAQGTNQLIDINGTRGDYFSISHQNSSNGLVGLGYYLEAKETTYANFTYGINAFYLAPIQVTGTVTQEQLFTNLSYDYSITNWPIYFAAKAFVKNKYRDGDHITLDAGIGPNIIHTGQFNEQPLLGSIIPDDAVAGQTSAAFTAMAGIGYRMNHVILGSAPLECGYRFFYLGQTNLRNMNTQIMNHFTTGQSYANALLCTITI